MMSFAYKVDELLALRDSVSESAVSIEKFPDEDVIRGQCQACPPLPFTFHLSPLTFHLSYQGTSSLGSTSRIRPNLPMLESTYPVTLLYGGARSLPYYYRYTNSSG
jgi:hypothetical protein